MIPFFDLYAAENPALAPCPTWEKQQWVRLFDVFVLGPFLLWLAWRVSGIVPIWIVIILIFFGATTIIYNAANYELNRRQHMKT